MPIYTISVYITKIKCLTGKEIIKLIIDFKRLSSVFNVEPKIHNLKTIK